MSFERAGFCASDLFWGFVGVARTSNIKTRVLGAASLDWHPAWGSYHRTRRRLWGHMKRLGVPLLLPCPD